MIGKIKHKGLRKLYEQGDRKGLDVRMVSKIEEVFSVLFVADNINEANIPGYRLHPLSGNLEGFYSIRITGNWRVIFRFEDGEAFDIDLVDYH